MKKTLHILRCSDSKARSRWEDFPYETADTAATVATALNDLNARGSNIAWECSCLQKKCGACAMVINGRPGLACDSFLRDLQGKQGGVITLEPLGKFPLVADLIVDRRILYAHSDDTRQWTQGENPVPAKLTDEAYDASRCLQCGCCVEVCPNCYPDGEFYGAASFVPGTRILAVDDSRERKKNYLQHVYSGCGKSMACQDICPAGIDIQHLLSKSNRLILWKIR